MPDESNVEKNARILAEIRDAKGKKASSIDIDPVTGKARPRKIVDVDDLPKPSPSPSPVATHVPEDADDEPKRADFPAGLPGVSLYNKALVEYRAKNRAMSPQKKATEKLLVAKP
jgi:hypothetical protein